MSTKQIGDTGENVAEAFLKKSGYKILKRNSRCKFGEIDIIAQYQNSLIFIEVKTRSGGSFGLPEESVNQRKLEHISQAGQYYASTHPNLPPSQRIEVVSIEQGRLRLIKID